MRIASLASSFAIAIAASVQIAPALAAEQSGPTLLTPAQRTIDTAAVAIVKAPEVAAARDEVLKAWSALPPAQLADGKSQLAGAVDEVVFAAARNAAEQAQPSPAIIWIEAPPYAHGSLKIPGSRFGIDTPDRIYRGASVEPGASYEIRGQRAAQPSNDDFLFEAADGLRTVGFLPAKNIDVAADGSFTITLDPTPANGRRNHLTLPAGANTLLIRDTLADWNSQSPNRLTITRTGGSRPAAASDAARKATVAQIKQIGTFNATMLTQLSQGPANQLAARVRGLDSGVEGAIIGTARFSLRDDEALVLDIDPQGARYTGVQLTDPWSRSIPYWNDFTSRSDRQAKPNADGSISFVVSPRDPGYANWVSTGGLHDGFVALRIENFTKTDVAKAVRGSRVVKLADLAGVLAADAVRVTPAQRTEELAQRQAGFRKRLTE